MTTQVYGSGIAKCNAVAFGGGERAETLGDAEESAENSTREPGVDRRFVGAGAPIGPGLV